MGTKLDEFKAGSRVLESFALSRLRKSHNYFKTPRLFKKLYGRIGLQIIPNKINKNARSNVRSQIRRRNKLPVTPKRPSMVCARTVHRVAFWEIFLLWAFLPPWWILENGIRRRKFVQVSLEGRPDKPKNSKCSNTISLVFVLKFSRTCTLCAVFQIFKFERRFGNSTARQDE